MVNRIGQTDTPQTRVQLRRAYQLIRSGQKAEAFDLIRPVLAEEPESVDGWWLAAFAAPTARESAFACQKVLMLKPDHWPAQQMLAEQQRRLAISTVLKGEVDPAQAAAIPLKAVQRPVTKPRGGVLTALIIIIGVLVALVGGGVLLVNLTGNNFGLPIGGIFSAEYDITAAITRQYTNVGEPTFSVTGTLVVGATVDYVFEGQAGMQFLVVSEFAGVGNALPGEALTLRDEKGVVIATAQSGSGVNVPLSVTIPKSGRYRLRLIGTSGTAQGTYSLQIVVRPNG